MSDSFLAQFGEEETCTVSEYTRRIKRLLEGSVGPEWIKGEVSNFRRQASGHLYFSLKDEGAQLPVVMFRGNAAGLDFELDNGVEIVVYGELSVYEPHGRYQLIARSAIASGQGRLHREFERLKKKLFEEGLFDKERKRPLPLAPQRVAFITSPSGAAIQDFIRILKRRGWGGRLTVIPAKVQGIEASRSLRNALAFALRLGCFDLIVIGRGGGSLEDMWCFNDETLARALAASPIPTISAVGHEIDFSLTDFVSDIRAETPSAAAELISSAYIECFNRIEYARETLVDRAEDGIALCRRTLGDYSTRLQAVAPQRSLETAKLRIDELSSRLLSAVTREMSRAKGAANQSKLAFGRLRPDRVAAEQRQRLNELAKRKLDNIDRTLVQIRHRLSESSGKFQSLSPKATLKRGYAILSQEDGKTITSVAELPSRNRLRATLSDGEKWLCIDRSEPESS